MPNNNKRLIAAIEKNAYPPRKMLRDYDPIILAAADKRVVLMGEASHGSLERLQVNLTVPIRWSWNY